MVRVALATSAPDASVTFPNSLAFTACDRPGTADTVSNVSRDRTPRHLLIDFLESPVAGTEIGVRLNMVLSSSSWNRCRITGPRFTILRVAPGARLPGSDDHYPIQGSAFRRLR